ncbi:restriction endonuclease subunit S, partial [Elizabethkingia bruuniana]|uniref:restriction endonuclease subunit S n=1 Tax=Elizabethkingia bruuniana TaxID=1756149 RepID=UPI00105696F2
NTLSKKIFSRELKFKDDNGNDYLEWQGKKLRDISIITMGQSPDSSSYNNDEIGVPLIQGNADIINRKSHPRQYTNAATKLCKVGDILLTIRAPVGYVAKSFHNACIGRGICSLENNIFSLSEFLYQFLLQFENQWKSIEQGSTFTSVNSSDIGSIKLKVPSIPEQQKITNVLFSIDSKIDVETKLLQKLEEQKKYLLQNLFI